MTPLQQPLHSKPGGRRAWAFTRCAFWVVAIFTLGASPIRAAAESREPVRHDVITPRIGSELGPLFRFEPPSPLSSLRVRGIQVTDAEAVFDVSWLEAPLGRLRLKLLRRGGLADRATGHREGAVFGFHLLMGLLSIQAARELGGALGGPLAGLLAAAALALHPLHLGAASALGAGPVLTLCAHHSASGLQAALHRRPYGLATLALALVTASTFEPGGVAPSFAAAIVLLGLSGGVEGTVPPRRLALAWLVVGTGLLCPAALHGPALSSQPQEVTHPARGLRYSGSACPP